VADVVLLAPGVVSTPFGYTVPGAQEIILKATTASYNGAGAGGSYVPTLQIIAPNGSILASCPVNSALAAGASADVSWFPSVGAGKTGAGSISEITSSTLTVTNPTGPTTDIEGSGGRIQLYSVLLAAPAPTFDITAIPGTYTGLQLIANLRSDGPTVDGNCEFTVNGNASVTTYNYIDSSTTSYQNTAFGKLCSSTGSPADDQHYGLTTAYFYDYAASINDHGIQGITGLIPQEVHTATWFAGTIFAIACQTAAVPITEITIAVDQGTNWQVGSYVQLYGLT
jgi:hypothetical protein